MSSFRVCGVHGWPLNMPYLLLKSPILTDLAPPPSLPCLCLNEKCGVVAVVQLKWRASIVSGGGGVSFAEFFQPQLWQLPSASEWGVTVGRPITSAPSHSRDARMSANLLKSSRIAGQNCRVRCQKGTWLPLLSLSS